MSLPRNVVREDHRLEEQAEKSSTALAELRWHWTMDETNPKRVSFTEYAAAISRAIKTVQRSAQSFDVYTSNPGITMADARTRANLKGDRLAAVEAVAKARGIKLETAEHKRRSEARRVQQIAAERAEEKGTSVEDEAPKVAAWIVKSEQATENTTAARREKTDLRVIAIEAQVLKAITAINRAIDEARGVDVNEEAIEFLDDSRDSLRKAWALLDAVLAGAADVDWDGEFAKLTGDVA